MYGTQVLVHVHVHVLNNLVCIEVLNVKVTVFILLLFASLPDCAQNQTSVSDE
jgi:hypothetical protein